MEDRGAAHVTTRVATLLPTRLHSTFSHLPLCTCRILKKVKDTYDVPIITDIHESWQAEKVAAVADIIQIPAFLCRQTDLLVAAARTGKVIQIKKGQFCAASVMRNSAEKCRHAGNPNVLVCERGTMFGYSDLIVDPRNFELMRDANCPVTADVTHSLQQPAGRALEVRLLGRGKRARTRRRRCMRQLACSYYAWSRISCVCTSSARAHLQLRRSFAQGGGVASGGMRELIPTVARTAVVCGVEGIFMEVHDNPTASPVDGPTQWPLRYETCANKGGASERRDLILSIFFLIRALQYPRLLPFHPTCRHLRRLLEELIAIAQATKAKEPFELDLTPVGNDFDPQAIQ